MMAFMETTCRECGCTEQDACVLFARIDSDDVVQTCHWAEPDLCSACTPEATDRWVHPRDRPKEAA